MRVSVFLGLTFFWKNSAGLKKACKRVDRTVVSLRWGIYMFPLAAKTRVEE